MTIEYRLFFGLHAEAFSADIGPEQIIVTESLSGVNQRIQYAMRIGDVPIVTGGIGRGKSTALRYVSQSLHPAQHPAA